MKELKANIYYLYKVSRPRFWMYTFGPALLVTFLGLGLPSDILSLPIILNLIYFLYPANLLIYGINDISDGDTDEFNQKKGDYELKHQKSLTNFLLTWIAIFNVPFWVYFAYSSNLSYMLGLLGFLFFSIQYSAKPIRAKSKPIIDGIFNVLYVLPAFCTMYLWQLPLNLQSLSLLFAGTLWCMAMHAYSAIPDIEADTKAGLNTTAVFLGQNKSYIYCFILYLLTAVIVLSFTNLYLATPLFLYPLVCFYTKLNPQHTFRVYKLFPYINTLVGFIISIQILLKLI